VDHSVLLLILNVCILLKIDFVEELKSYRDFDLHYTNELPLSSFIPIPEDKEVGFIDVSHRVIFFVVIGYFDYFLLQTLPSTRNIPKKSSQPSLFEVGSFPGAAAMKSFDRHV
jgi:hypothetical protein